MSATGVEIASAYLTVQTRMPGIQKTLDAALARTNVSKAGEQIGRRLSDSMTKSMRTNVADKFAGITAAALDKQTAATKSLSSAEFEHRKARAGAAASNASVLVAEEKLTKLKASGKASTGQLAAAEAALAKERTGLEAANRGVAQALVNVNAAKRDSTRASTAYQEALTQEQSKSARSIAMYPELAARMEDIGNRWQYTGKQISDVGSRLTSNITKPAAIAGSAVGGLVGALGFRRLVGIDRAKAQFEGLGYQVDAVMSQVDKGVTNTALSMADGAQLAVSSLAATVPLNQLEKHLKRISNTSAAYGVEASHAGTLINQAYIDGRANYGLLSQMQQNSIPILSALADTYGKTGEEIKKMAQGGEISIEMLNNALDNKAGAAAASYAKSWEGIYKNVMSNLGRFGESVLSGAFPQAKAALEDFLATLKSDESKAFASELGAAFGSVFSNMLDRIRGLIEAWQGLDRWQQTALRNLGVGLIAAGPALQIIGGLTSGIGGLIRSGTGVVAFASGFKQAISGASTATVEATGLLEKHKTAAQIGVVANGAFAASVTAARTAFGNFALSARNNPFTFIAAALAAVIAGIVLFVRNTETGRALWEKFTTALQPIVPVLEGIGTKIADVFGGILEVVAPVLVSVVSTVADVFGRVGPAIGQTLGVVGGVLANVFAAIGPVLAQIAQHIGSVFTAIGPAIGSVFTALAPLVGGVLTALAPVVTGLLEAIAPSLESLGTTGGQIAEAFAPLAPMFADTGARIVEAFGPVAATFTNELMPAFAELGAAFAAIGPQFAELVGQVVTAVAGVVSEIVAALLPVFLQLVNEVLPMLASAFAALAPVVLQVLNTVAPLVAELVSSLLPVILQLAQGVLPIFMQVLSAVVPIIAQVVGAIAPLIADLVSKLVPVIMNIVTTVLPILMQVFMAVIPVILQVVAALAPLITTLLEVLIPIIQALLDVVATVFEALAPIIQGALQVVTGIITTITGIITGNWSMVWDGIKSIFVGIWNTIKAVVIGAINIVRSVIVNAITIIRTIWTTIWNGIKAVLSGVWSFITSMVQTRINQLKLGIQVGIFYIRSVWENVWNTIRNVVSNVWTGIKSTVTTMMDWIKTKPKAAFESARDAIGDAWNGIKELAKKPVRFVIDTVINGMIRTINGFLPKKWKLSEVALPKGFRTGGPTGNAGINEIAGVVHGREHVIRAESTARMNREHPGVLDHMNRYGTLPGFRKGGYVNPLPRGSYSISQPFHANHNGIDLAAPTGTKVMAAADGRVTHSGWEPGGSFGGGNQVNILHAGNILTWYAHLSSIAASVGKQVKQGQVIGRVGSTGNSTGPHLHYMIEQGYRGSLGSGSWINPAPYMTGSTTPKGGGGAVDAADGLMGWVEKKLKDAGSGLWGNLGAGLAMSVAENVVEFIKSKIPVDIGQATLYDDGGWLQPGRHLTENRTGKPEPVFTSRQWDLLSDVRGGGRDSRPVYVQNPFTGEYLLAKVDERAEDAIDRAEENAERNRRLVVGG